MPQVVGVAFRRATKVYYFDPAGVENLQPGDRVIVETSRGRTLGYVVLAPRQVAETEISGTLKPVVRRATAWDMVQQDQMNHKEAETLAVCRERAAALGLDIKLVRVEYAFDGSSVVVYFTSEQRVDFRALVHELSQALRTRVEMRQVGVRDEAKFMGGFGKCGRELCCATWLREFTPVSIKMAKAQDLPLNSSEVSGLCGRLLCCLAYENDFYVESRKQMPRVNSIIETPQGPGKVKQINVLRNSVTVQVEGPNETVSLVEVPVPEPVLTGLRGCEGCPKRQAVLTTSEDEFPGVVSEGEEEQVEDTDRAPTATGPAPAEPASPASPQRKSRSRRRRR